MLKLYENLIDKIGSFTKLRDSLNVPHGLLVKISQGSEDPSQGVKDRVALLCSKYDVLCDYSYSHSIPEDKSGDFMERLIKFSSYAFMFRPAGKIVHGHPLLKVKEPNEFERFAFKVKDYALWFEQLCNDSLAQVGDDIYDLRKDDSSISTDNPYIHHFNYLKETYHKSYESAAILLFQIRMLDLKPTDNPYDPFEATNGSASKQMEDGLPYMLTNNISYFSSGDYQNRSQAIEARKDKVRLLLLESERKRNEKRKIQPEVNLVTPGDLSIYGKLIVSLNNIQELSKRLDISVLSLSAWMIGSNHPYLEDKNKLMSLANELGIECDPPPFKALSAPPESIPTPSYTPVHVDHSDPPRPWQLIYALPEEERYARIRSMSPKEKEKYYADCKCYKIPQWPRLYLLPEDLAIEEARVARFYKYSASSQEELMSYMHGLPLWHFFGGFGHVEDGDPPSGINLDYDGPIPEFITLNQDVPFADHATSGHIINDHRSNPNRLQEYLKVREFIFNRFNKTDRFKGIPIKNPKFHANWIEDGQGSYTDYNDDSEQEF